LGLIARWATPESAGAGVTDLDDVASPTIVVGHDLNDEVIVNAGGQVLPAVAASWSILLWIPNQDCWLHRFEVFGFAVADEVIARLITPSGSPSASVLPFLNDGPPRSGGTFDNTNSLVPPIGGMRVWPNVPVIFDPPGFFVPQGKAIRWGCTVVNRSFGVVWTYRTTGGDLT
jgi:hypothetical protein